jgi:hypothetical protein
LVQRACGKLHSPEGSEPAAPKIGSQLPDPG